MKSKKLSFIAKIKSNSFPRHSNCNNTYFSASGSEINFCSATAIAVEYTSLKDSKANFQFHSSLDNIPMCNFLVNRAALAYLSPMPATSSRTSHRKQFFIRTWDKVNLPVRACVNFINRHVVSKITGVFDKVMAAIHVTRFA
ncbi:hypothetical protein KPL70_023916 [Citrus sinensis]|nr:hypothetical protein KPL70_023916 [Citrus sinensis]